MKFMLDTNVCVDLMRTGNPHILRHLQRHPPTAICISSISLSELEYGAAKSAQPERNRLALAEFMAPIEVLPYDDRVAPIYGQVRATLEKAGTPIGSLDTLIAAHALASGRILVTDNAREFDRVAGLTVQNWAR
jgi:tRNA(fMet)-specific endonuclease VapC